MAARPRKLPTIYVLKVTLTGFRPPIWRRVLVSSKIRLRTLHAVIQIVMGWTNSHLHAFYKDGAEWGMPDPDGYDGGRMMDERKYRLDEILDHVGDSLDYVYDFGDNWQHRVKLERAEPMLEEKFRPICIDGRGGCPEEDSGGRYTQPAARALFDLVAVDQSLSRVRWTKDALS